MELSESSNPELFRLARCGLGALGVVAELTLQCIPAHRLVETTWVSSMAEIRKNHQRYKMLLTGDGWRPEAGGNREGEHEECEKH